MTFMLNRNGHNTGLFVVLDVLVSIDHIVEDCPEDARGIETASGFQNSRRLERTDAHDGKPQNIIPGPGEAENDLWVMRETFP